jgi:hypothetical protein
MRKSRREFLKTAAATGTIATVPAMPATAKHGQIATGEIVFRFAQLPGWYAESGDDPETVARFFSAINESLTLVKSSLTKD